MDYYSRVDEHLSMLKRKLDSKINLICQKYCYGTVPHSSICNYWRSRHASNGDSNRFINATPAVQPRQPMGCFSSTYKVCNIYTELYYTEICPPVQSKTVYMDFYNEGYLVHTFEMVQAEPSVSVVNQLKVTLPAESLCDINAAVETPDISIVEAPRFEEATCDSPCTETTINLTTTDTAVTFCQPTEPVRFSPLLPPSTMSDETHCYSHPSTWVSHVLLHVTNTSSETQYDDIWTDHQHLLWTIDLAVPMPSLCMYYMLLRSVSKNSVLVLCDIHVINDQSKVFDPGIITSMLLPRDRQLHIPIPNMD